MPLVERVALEMLPALVPVRIFLPSIKKCEGCSGYSTAKVFSGAKRLKAVAQGLSQSQAHNDELLYTQHIMKS